jgi:glycosyltransferase involved in cell wall biosynthesis
VRALASVPSESRALVVDAESTDATASLARERGARVVVWPWAGFVATRRYALALVDTGWTFMLDADEALDGPLRATLAALEPPDDVDAYAIPRTTFFCGRPIRYGTWGADAPVRLFRTERATLVAEPAAGGTADLHERWTVPGHVGRVDGTLAHDSYPTFASYRTKFARYTSLEAAGMRGSPFALARAIAVAALRAPWYLIVRSGWRDGWRGAFLAFSSAAYPMVVAWKAWRRG